MLCFCCKQILIQKNSCKQCFHIWCFSYPEIRVILTITKKVHYPSVLEIHPLERIELTRSGCLFLEHIKYANSLRFTVVNNNNMRLVRIHHSPLPRGLILRWKNQNHIDLWTVGNRIKVEMKHPKKFLGLSSTTKLKHYY